MEWLINTHKYDSMRRNEIIYALICINSHVLLFLISMLSKSVLAWCVRETWRCSVRCYEASQWWWLSLIVTEKHKMGRNVEESHLLDDEEDYEIKEELKTIRSYYVIMSDKILSMLNKLCRDQQTRRRSRQSRKHYRLKNHKSVAWQHEFITWNLILINSYSCLFYVNMMHVIILFRKFLHWHVIH